MSNASEPESSGSVSFSRANSWGELNHYRAVPTGTGMWELFVTLEDDSGKYPEEKKDKLFSTKQVKEMEAMCNSPQDKHHYLKTVQKIKETKNIADRKKLLKSKELMRAKELQGK